MALTLKLFQQKTLAALQKYLDRARIEGPDRAYARYAGSPEGRIPAYRSVAGLDLIPYVCLRLPTGGGKTLLAAHSVAVASRSYLEQDYPLVLWLVPTNTIRNQTLEALKNPTHPYRMALDGAFDGRVGVFDMSEVDRIRPKDVNGQICVVVGTLATLRVNDTDGRKIYAHNESFEPHFARVPAQAPNLEKIESGPDVGKVKFSFANLLHLYRPLVLMDEAHNARTRLTFETLQRISPACIIEFTATPDTDDTSGSNVLYWVSASELKAEDMIKLPILLTEHQSWQEAVHDAVATRQRLAEDARTERPYVRPLVLFQAEAQNRTVTVEVLKQHLLEHEGIRPETVAVATGNQREIDGIDLYNAGCPIEYIITVQALKEGWDCSFAYVFCSVANVHSGRDVEQLLGRVLRMPYALRRQADSLNRAYAHVFSPNFAAAANDLRDSLVAMGFDAAEAQAYIRHENPQPAGPDVLPAGHIAPPLRLTLAQAPDLSALSTAERERVRVEPLPSGEFSLTVVGLVPEALTEAVLSAAPSANHGWIREALVAYAVTVPATPAERGEDFFVPRLCVTVHGEIEIAERELFLEAGRWSLVNTPAELPELRFDETAKTFAFDVEGAQLVWKLVDERAQISFLESPWTETDLVRWLDGQLRQPDIRQEEMLTFLARTVQHLTRDRHFSLATLIRGKFILAKVLQEKIKGYRQAACYEGYRALLFSPQAQAQTSANFTFRYNPDCYPVQEPYRGGYQFRRHFYALIGDLKADGEEFRCAQDLDRLPGIAYWVRNLVRQPHASFWLPTSTDNFYPDFVAKLEDGRVLVVEYKGDHLTDAADAREKQEVGALWEARSQGRGLFLMAERRDEGGRDVYAQMIMKSSGR